MEVVIQWRWTCLSHLILLCICLHIWHVLNNYKRPHYEALCLHALTITLQWGICSSMHYSKEDITASLKRIRALFDSQRQLLSAKMNIGKVNKYPGNYIEDKRVKAIFYLCMEFNKCHMPKLSNTLLISPRYYLYCTTHDTQRQCICCHHVIRFQLLEDHGVFCKEMGGWWLQGVDGGVTVTGHINTEYLVTNTIRSKVLKYIYQLYDLDDEWHALTLKRGIPHTVK